MLSFFNLAGFWVLSVMRLTGEALTAMAPNSQHARVEAALSQEFGDWS